MKKLLLVLCMLFVAISGHAQLNLFTSPPLTGGNGAGSGGITFNLRANSAILVDSIFVALSGTLNAPTELEVWYSTTPINGNPAVGTNPAFVQLLPNQPTTVGQAGTTAAGGFVFSRIAMPGGPLLIPAGSVYGFYVGVPTGSNGSPVYQTFTVGSVDTFFNSFATIYTGTNVGYGGPRPGHVNTPRQFVGGISYIPASGRDARLAGLISPVTLSIGSNTVTARVQNAAADPIAQVDFGYQFNNNPPVLNPGVAVFPALSPGQNFDHTFVAPINIPANGTYQIRVWATNANGLGADNNTANDTLTVNLCTGLSGAYTIGGPTADYPTVQAAVAALSQCGVTGQVNFLINPGTYIGSHTIPNFPNAGGFGVTFASATSLASDVILIHDTAAATATNRTHFTVNTSTRISFQNLTLRRTINPGAAGQGIIVFSNPSSSGEVIGCNVIELPQTNNTFNNGIIYRGSNGLFINNTFNGFYYAIWLDGPASNTFANTNSIISNTFVNNVYRSVYALNQANAVVASNQFTSFVGTSTVGAAVWTANNINTEISSNNVSGAMSAYAFLIVNPNADTLVPTNANRIYNNVINGTQAPTITGTTMVVNPIHITGSFSASVLTPMNPRDAIEVKNNTVRYTLTTTSASTIQAGFYLTGGSVATPFWSRIVVRNNHFEINPLTGNLPTAFRLFRLVDQSQLDSLQSSNNNFVLGGTVPPNMFRVNTPALDFATLAAWRTATGKDTMSLSLTPNFLSSSLLVPTNIALDNKGIPVSYITSDVTGVARNATTPDIGAYEFTGSQFAQISLTALGDTLPVASRPLLVNIQDTASSITAGTARVFYKKTSQSTWLVDSLPTITGNNYAFTINHTALGGVAVFDTIQYYVAVSSASGTVTTAPLGGIGIHLSNAVPPPSLFSYLILTNISGTYRVGTSGPADFANLTTAVNFINSGLFTGSATFLLIDTLYSAGETFPMVINNRPGLSAVNTLTIRPDSTRSNVLIQGTFSGSNGLIVLNGVNHFHLNGANSASGTSRNLTIRSTSVADNSTVILLRSRNIAPVRHVTISNVNITGGSNTVTSTFGIHATNATITTFALADSLQNLTIRNVAVRRAYYGIFLRGATTGTNNGTLIENSQIGSSDTSQFVIFRGVDVTNTFNLRIRNNQVFNLVSTSATSQAAIEVGTSPGAVIERNRIWGVKNLNTGGWGAWGVNVLSGDSVRVLNNVIYDLRTLNYSNTSNTFNAFGIRITGGTNHRIHYNSVYLYGAYTNVSTAGAAAAAFGITSTLVTGDVRNNIFAIDASSTSTGIATFMAVWLPASYNFANLTLNNNAYHVPSNAQSFVGKLGTTAASGNYVSVADWKAISSVGNPNNDAASVPPTGNALPPFTSLTDLTIPTGTLTPIESGGVVIAALGTPNTDFNGTNRPGGTGIAPDMGAYEFDGIGGTDLFPPIIDSFLVTPRSNQCVPTNRTISVFARDNAGGRGIDTVRVNYTIAGTAQTPIVLTRTAGTAMAGTWTGTLPAATSANVLVAATVIARDSNANFTQVISMGSFRDDYIVPNAGNDTTILAGDTATLRGTGSSFLGTLGTGTLVNTTTTYPAGYGNWYWGARQQFLILASELTASGIAPGALTSLAFDVVTPSGTALQNYTISLGATTQTSLTAWVTPVTQVFTTPSFLDTTGWNTHTFQTPFNWNGASNIVVEVCFNNSSFTNNSITRMTATPFTASYWYISDAAGVCANTLNTSNSVNRPNMRIGGGYPATWTNLTTGTVVASNQAVVRVTPVVTTSYALTLTDNICSKSDTVTVFVTANNISDIGMEAILTPAPTATPQLNQAYVVKAVIRNHGNVPATGFDVAFRVNNGAELNANAISRTIQPNDTIHHTFTQSWTPTSGGDLRLCAYTRWASDTNASNDTSCVQFTAVGVESVNHLLSRVYPNPADQFVLFDFGTNEGQGTLELRDQLGRVVRSQHIDLSTNERHEIRTDNLAVGVYNYRFILKNQVQNGQVIISR
ncbi:MAG: T9SS type A sorting domain-containing protein [Sphingobacteriaceae bacterium]|nr:T9SS type A sorting domain-containing protein [Sphingobacteriaceae bacterium]